MKQARTRLINLMKSYGYDPIGLDFIQDHRKVYIDGVDHYDVKEVISIVYTQDYYKVRRYYMVKKEIVPEIVAPQMLLEITQEIVKGGMIML